MESPYNTALVLTGGAFATSLASVVSHHFKRIIIKVRTPRPLGILCERDKVKVALTFDEVKEHTLGSVDLIISGLPTAGVTPFCTEHEEEIRFYLEQSIPFVSLTKGIEAHSLKLPDDLYFDFFQEFRDLFCFLSGPSFAQEILEEQITLVSLAGRSRQVLEKTKGMLDTHYFKVFPSYDVKGVLLGGALKNVLAIAGGIIEGLGYNDNTRAALITQGIYDMLRLGKVFNARPETFYGLSGMGDLILSTTGPVGRNKQFGKQLALGTTLENFFKTEKILVEGYGTALAAERLCQLYALTCPLFRGVYRILYEGASPKEVIQELLNLPISIR